LFDSSVQSLTVTMYVIKTLLPLISILSVAEAAAWDGMNNNQLIVILSTSTPSCIFWKTISATISVRN